MVGYYRGAMWGLIFVAATALLAALAVVLFRAGSAGGVVVALFLVSPLLVLALWVANPFAGFLAFFALGLAWRTLYRVTPRYRDLSERVAVCIALVATFLGLPPMAYLALSVMCRNTSC